MRVWSRRGYFLFPLNSELYLALTVLLKEQSGMQTSSTNISFQNSKCHRPPIYLGMTKESRTGGGGGWGGVGSQMAPQLSSLAALADDIGTVSSSHVAANNSVQFQEHQKTHLLALEGAGCTWGTDRCR